MLLLNDQRWRYDGESWAAGDFGNFKLPRTKSKCTLAISLNSPKKLCMSNNDRKIICTQNHTPYYFLAIANNTYDVGGGQGIKWHLMMTKWVNYFTTHFLLQYGKYTVFCCHQMHLKVRRCMLAGCHCISRLPSTTTTTTFTSSIGEN